jgi:hypothetical protein
MAELGLDPEAVELRRIDTEAAAEHEEFGGSPTIRVNGIDVQPIEEGAQVGLSCRVYRRRDGRISPLPDPEDVREALASAGGGGGSG